MVASRFAASGVHQSSGVNQSGLAYCSIYPKPSIPLMPHRILDSLQHIFSLTHTLPHSFWDHHNPTVLNGPILIMTSQITFPSCSCKNAVWANESQWLTQFFIFRTSFASECHWMGNKSPFYHIVHGRFQADLLWGSSLADCADKNYGNWIPSEKVIWQSQSVTYYLYSAWGVYLQMNSDHYAALLQG